MASPGARFALTATSLLAVGTIVLVHFQQKTEKEVPPLFFPACILLTFQQEANTDLPTPQAMHAGVVRDMEQQRLKRERQLDFDMQRQLEAEYKQTQSVRNTLSEMDDKSATGR